MDRNQLKQQLEALTCHVHGGTASVIVLENNEVEIESCCLLFRQQLLLMTGTSEKSPVEQVIGV